MAQSRQPVVHTFKMKKRIARLERDAMSNAVTTKLREAWALVEDECVLEIESHLNVSQSVARKVMSLMQAVAPPSRM